MEGKKVMQLSMNDDEDLTEAEAQFMIAKLKRAGRYSTRADKRRENEHPEPCPDALTQSNPITKTDVSLLIKSAEIVTRSVIWEDRRCVQRQKRR